MGLAHSPRIVTDGLVLAMDTANRKSYTPNSTTWIDAAGSTITANTNNGLYDANDMGSFILDTGSKDLVFANNQTLASTFSTNNFTIIVVAKSTDAVYPRSRFPLYVNQNPTTTAQKGWSVGHGITSTQIEIRQCDGANLSSIFLSHSVAANTIYHRAFVVDRSSGISTKYYVNGSYIGEAAAANVTGSIYTSGGMLLGNVWGWRYIGHIYTFYVYNRVLTQSEVKQNFNAIRGRYGL